MSDHNDYLLPEPCLRLDFGFGEQYQSIELGDGTGYLRLRGSEDRETELRERIASLNAENVDIDVENSKLRELVRDMWGVMWACAEQRCTHRHEGCFRVHGNHGDICVSGKCWYEDRMSELGIEEE